MRSARPFVWDTPNCRTGGRPSRPETLCRPKTIESIRTDAAGAEGTSGDPFGRRLSVVERFGYAKEFKLYANLRPARTLIPGGPFRQTSDLVVRGA